MTAGLTANSSEPADLRPSPLIDTTVPHSARIWNYWLGGKDHYPIDREAADAFAAVYPQIVEVVRHGRYFLCRVVRFLAGERGVRQFLDIGPGLPTVDNTHQIAQRIDPASRTVYVDNDPLALTHARALMAGTRHGPVGHIDADLADPTAILAQAAQTLDFDRPVAVLLMATLGYLTDDDQACQVITRLSDGLPAGSYLALWDMTSTSDNLIKAQSAYNHPDGDRPQPYELRSPETIGRLMRQQRLELIEPGQVPISHWRPEHPLHAGVEDVDTVGVVAKVTSPRRTPAAANPEGITDGTGDTAARAEHAAHLTTDDQQPVKERP